MVGPSWAYSCFAVAAVPLRSLSCEVLPHLVLHTDRQRDLTLARKCPRLTLELCRINEARPNSNLVGIVVSCLVNTSRLLQYNQISWPCAS
jgi:hypothetical protein